MKLELLKKFSAKSKKHIPFPVYLSYCLVIALLLTSVTSARYLSSMSGSDNAGVAKWVVDVEYGDSEIVMTKPDSSVSQEVTETYTFTVKNNKDGIVSEVAIQYDILIGLEQELPEGVTIKLDGTVLVFKDNQYTKYNAGTLSASQEDSDNYTLSFIGDFTILDEYGDIPINIKVNAEQID